MDLFLFNVVGFLFYLVVGYMFNEYVVIQGYKIYFVIVDMMVDVKVIKK